jgi:hypothetical protein
MHPLRDLGTCGDFCRIARLSVESSYVMGSNRFEAERLERGRVRNFRMALAEPHKNFVLAKNKPQGEILFFF